VIRPGRLDENFALETLGRGRQGTRAAGSEA
jgi:hypothetical protein